MTKTEYIMDLIKDSVKSNAPEATVILYGSYARSEQNETSDIDLLILLDKEPLSRDDINRIKYPLYEIEFETSTIISPIVLSRDEWESKHSVTPFYKNVLKEGVVI